MEFHPSIYFRMSHKALNLIEMFVLLSFESIFVCVNIHWNYSLFDPKGIYHSHSFGYPCLLSCKYLYINIRWWQRGKSEVKCMNESLEVGVIGTICRKVWWESEWALRFRSWTFGPFFLVQISRTDERFAILSTVPWIFHVSTVQFYEWNSLCAGWSSSDSLIFTNIDFSSHLLLYSQISIQFKLEFTSHSVNVPFHRV